MACETNLLHNSREISGEADIPDQIFPQNLILSPPPSSVHLQALLSCSGLDIFKREYAVEEKERRSLEKEEKGRNLIHDEQLAQRMNTESTGETKSEKLQ